MDSRRRGWVAGLLLAAAAPAPTPTPPPRPRVAVAIVVDQLASWVAEEKLPRLPRSGGLARILKGGTWVRRSDYLHGFTETAPGHAALFTGRSPRENGITANYVRRTHAAAAVASPLEDLDAKLVGVGGPIPARPGISLRQLTGKTLSEALLERDPQSVVIAISTKDRGAAFAGARTRPGQRAPRVVWWDHESSGVVTSTAFAPALPSWVTQPRIPSRFRWDVGSPVPKLARLPDDQQGESEDLGGRTFPHVFSVTGRTFRVTPLADRLTVDLALAAVKAEKTTHPMLLALSFSRYDYVGHRYGPDSWEAWQALLELDAELARLFDGLDAALGKDAYAVVLSADHGIAPLPATVTSTSAWCSGPNPYEKPCETGTRLRNAEIMAELEKGSDPVFDRVVDSLVYLKEGRAPHPGARAKLESLPGVAQVLEVCRLDPSRSELERLIFNTVPACDGPKGDALIPAYYLVQERGSFFADPPDVVGHGTPYPYDRMVPLLVNYAGKGKTATRAEATFRSFYASLWYALTGEASGETIGR